MINKIHHTIRHKSGVLLVTPRTPDRYPIQCFEKQCDRGTGNEEVEGASDFVNRCTGVALRHDPLRLITRT